MNEALRAELLEMEREDRAVRADLGGRGELHRPGYHRAMEAVHRRHNARMRAIVAAHGWPGYALVGEEAVVRPVSASSTPFSTRHCSDNAWTCFTMRWR